MTELTREGARSPEKDAAADLREQVWSNTGQTKLEDSLAAARSSGNAQLVELKISSGDDMYKSSGLDAGRQSQADKQEAKVTDASPQAEAGKRVETDSQKRSQSALKNEPGEANKFLLQAAEQTVNQSIYQLPRWAQLPKPTPGLGCVSSFSNRYREALHLAGVLDTVNSDKYRKYYQVNMDELNKVMGRDNLLKPVADRDLKEGDIIEGVTPDTSKRHLGIVGGMENGQRMVYDNFGGTWRKEPLLARFGDYKEKYFYRAFLPSS